MTAQADVYRRLQRHLDALPVPFPATRSGVELSLLERLFSPEEAEVALGLSAVPEPIDKIQGRVPGRAREDLERMLDAMAAKGAIFSHTSKDGTKRYSRAPLVIGMYEEQVDRLTPELQRAFDAYASEAFAATLLAGRTLLYIL